MTLTPSRAFSAGLGRDVTLAFCRWDGDLAAFDLRPYHKHAPQNPTLLVCPTMHTCLTSLSCPMLYERRRRGITPASQAASSASFQVVNGQHVQQGGPAGHTERYRKDSGRILGVRCGIINLRLTLLTCYMLLAFLTCNMLLGLLTCYVLLALLAHTHLLLALLALDIVRKVLQAVHHVAVVRANTLQVLLPSAKHMTTTHNSYQHAAVLSN
eukprot:1160578-Pelagomonas_calceolata.AAC.11